MNKKTVSKKYSKIEKPTKREGQIEEWLSKWVSKNKIIRFLIIASLPFALLNIILVYFPISDIMTPLSSNSKKQLINAENLNKIDCLFNDPIFNEENLLNKNIKSNIANYDFKIPQDLPIKEVSQRILRQVVLCNFKQVEKKQKMSYIEITGLGTVEQLLKQLTININNSRIKLIVESK